MVFSNQLLGYGYEARLGQGPQRQRLPAAPVRMHGERGVSDG
jgi:hypothetical protein